MIVVPPTDPVHHPHWGHTRRFAEAMRRIRRALATPGIKDMGMTDIHLATLDRTLWTIEALVKDFETMAFIVEWNAAERLRYAREEGKKEAGGTEKEETGKA